ncbi:YrrS family protein [Mesobacillus foraminis]|uniref:YrrS family protein n=1 Tax=Mesobacillus foraminis TaxID=279826 RepID=UPI001BEC2877|nr:YrrS family protein [Mesobacillus foraminis]MBT2754637.1 YrrS family protein [Mesobacillus foraminis]
MKDDFENQNEGLRSGKLAKRRKTNLVLNSLIAIVLLLIIFVSVNIFFGDVESKGTNEDTAAESKTEESAKENAGSNPSGDTEAKEDSTEAEEETDAENKEEEDSEPVVTEGGSSPDVKKTIENPDWEPIGTSQSGEHVAVYDQNAVDWQEMIKAISYATGIDSNNMTVWFLGNNGGPNSAAGTISEKGGSVKYRVAIEWVDGKGWKPVKVEELK